MKFKLHLLIFRYTERRNLSTRPLDSSPPDWKQEAMVYMDDDPVYPFGFETLFNYLLLRPVRLRLITVLRRLVCIFAIWIWVIILLSISSYQRSFFPFDALQAFGDGYLMISANLLPVHNLFIYHSILCQAAIQTALFFIVLSPFFLDPRPLSVTLSWDESKTTVGSYMLKHDSKGVNNHKNCRTLHFNLKLRMKYMLKNFWRFMFHRFLVPFPTPHTGFIPFRIGFYILKFPLVLVSVALITLPIFTVFLGIVHNTRINSLCRCCHMYNTAVIQESNKIGNRCKVEAFRTEVDLVQLRLPIDTHEQQLGHFPSQVKIDEDQPGNSHIGDTETDHTVSLEMGEFQERSDSLQECNTFCCLDWVTCPFLFICHLLWTFLTLTFILLTCEMFLFISIDIIRTLSQSLRILLFVVAFFVYLRQTFSKFNDKYRQLKNDTFTVLLERLNVSYMAKVDDILDQHLAPDVGICLWTYVDGHFNSYRNKCYQERCLTSTDQQMILYDITDHSRMLIIN